MAEHTFKVTSVWRSGGQNRITNNSPARNVFLQITVTWPYYQITVLPDYRTTRLPYYQMTFT
jgi:hypothetical protein